MDTTIFKNGRPGPYAGARLFNYNYGLSGKEIRGWKLLDSWGTKRLAQLGDINFVGREPQTDVVAGLSFTRGNVYVSVRSAGEKSVDVSGIAAYLDGPPGTETLWCCLQRMDTATEMYTIFVHKNNVTQCPLPP